jgi:hypothetical protein
MLRVLAIEERNLEFLPGQIRTSLARRQGLALLAATTTLGFNLIAAFDLFGVRNDRDHHAVAARVNTRFLTCLAVGNDTIFRAPRHGDDVLLLGFQNAASGSFDLLSQTLAQRCVAASLL